MLIRSDLNDLWVAKMQADKIVGVGPDRALDGLGDHECRRGGADERHADCDARDESESTLVQAIRAQAVVAREGPWVDGRPGWHYASPTL